MLNKHFCVSSVNETTRQPVTEHRILWQEGTADIYVYPTRPTTDSAPASTSAMPVWLLAISRCLGAYKHHGSISTWRYRILCLYNCRNFLWVMLPLPLPLVPMTANIG